MTQQEDDASSITTAKLKKKKKNHICEMRHNQDFKIYKQYHTSRCAIWLYIGTAVITACQYTAISHVYVYDIVFIQQCVIT